jgi:hypothetical protein
MSVELIAAEANDKKSIRLGYRFIEDLQLQVPQRDVPPPDVETPGKPIDENTELAVGSKMLCDWAGKWRQVVILKVLETGEFRVHWEGWSDTWDEDVARSRLRFFKDSP